MIIVGHLAEEQSAQQQAELNAATAVSGKIEPVLVDHQSYLIPKPLGSAGDGYCIIEEMGLGDDKLTYNAIVLSVEIY